MNQVKNEETTDAAWNGLYRIGGAAALIAALIFRRWLAAEFMLLRSTGIINSGPSVVPSSVVDWFTLLQTHTLIGLILLNVFDLVNYALVGLIFLGLYAALVQTNKSSMTLAIALCLVGIAVYFSSNQSFSMLSLSKQYAAATTDAQRSMFLAAGQAMLASYNPGVDYQGTGFYMSFFLVNLAGLIVSVVMLRSSIFSKVAAYMGILANSFGLGYFIALAFAPAMVFIPLSVSAPFLLIWYLLIARRLLQLGSGVLKREAQ